MSAIKFWGIKVKPGESVKCVPGDDHYLHLSQASLGEVKKDKGNENIVINLKFNNQKLVIGTLSANKCPQVHYDLVFEKEFELSHNWKNGSVFFVGYQAFAGDENMPDGFTGKTRSNGELAKLAKSNVNDPKADLTAKSSVKTEEQKKSENKDDEDDDSDDNEDDLEDESDDEEMVGGEDDSADKDVDEDDSSQEEDEETPNKVDGNKRPLGSASKTPAPEKKAKLVTPVGSQKTGGGADGKKSGHTATPHPAKHAGQRLAANNKSKQTPLKSGGSASCKSCNRTFRDESALSAHTKAKHPAK